MKRKKSIKSLKIFLDTSVILSGLASDSGGSAKLLDAGKMKKFKLTATSYVFEEASRHLSKLNIPPQKLERLLSAKIVKRIKDPPKNIASKFEKITYDIKDTPIIAGAVKSASDFLISLDKKHILTPEVKRAIKPINVCTPKVFWSLMAKSQKESLTDGTN